MTAKEFYERHVGKAIDTDGGYGVQCVDLFKAFTKENYGISNYTCGNGWASGLWINRKSRPYYDKFIEVSLNDLQDGDWLFWNNGSKSCPNSHVAMYYQGKFFGQNQCGKSYATLMSYSTDGVLGVLRPKMYVKSSTNNGSGKNYVNLPPIVDSWRVYDLNVSPVKANAKAKLNPKKFGGLSYYVYAYHDGGTTAEIQTSDFGRCKIYIKDTCASITIDKYNYSKGNH